MNSSALAAVMKMVVSQGIEAAKNPKRPGEEDRGESPPAKRHETAHQVIDNQWTCSLCDEKNKATRERCNNCDLPREEHQWTCSRCDEVNNAGRKTCNNCNYSRAEMQKKRVIGLTARATGPKEQPEDRFTPLRQRLADGSVALAQTEWLEHWFIRQQAQLKRRQELPEEALASAERAVGSVDTDLATIVLSHGWLGEWHADRFGNRRDDLSRMFCNMKRFSTLNINMKFAFWDFMSLHQPRRTAEEHIMFRCALDCVHLLYINPRWKVYRITTLPSIAENETPYAERGWCYFETTVALEGCKEVVTIHNGVQRQMARAGATRIPLTPDRFAQELESKKFTSLVDRDVVTDLYTKAFEFIAEKETLEAHEWGDTEVQQLLTALPQLTGLESVRINNRRDGCAARVSAAVETELNLELKIRGGQLVVEQ